jgi:hypothetical protein
VAIMTDRFVVSAREIAAIEGLPEYPFVVIEHPIAGNPTEELHEKADRALAAILARLTPRR